MKKQAFLMIIGLVLMASCNKKDDKTLTRVGFYYTDNTGSSNEKSTCDLYVDNEYKGKIHCLQGSPVCGDSMLLYLTLDSKKHQVDVKNDAGEYMNAEYVQISENKCGSGSGKNSKKVKDGGHGSSFSKKTGDDCAIMCFTR